MTPTILPAWQITQGISFYWEARVLDDYPATETPLADWAAHTAKVEIAPSLDNPLVWAGSATCTADGYTTLVMTEADTLALTTSRSIGSQNAAIAEITIIDPSGAVAMIWHAPVRIYRSIQA